MNDFTVIGLCGAARSGKDTVADWLVTEMDYERIAFADPIKDMICTMLDVNLEWIDRNKEVEMEGIGSPRKLLQTLGTEWGRKLVNKELWITLARRDIKLLCSYWSCPGVVIPDVRFDNEACMILNDYGGQIWKVERDNAPAIAPHVSEAGIDQRLITRTITNNGDIEDLFAQLKQLELRL
jgi:hypothetical protein